MPKESSSRKTRPIRYYFLHIKEGDRLLGTKHAIRCANADVLGQAAEAVGRSELRHIVGIEPVYAETE